MICSEPLSPTTVAARTVTLVNLNFAYRARPTKTGHWGRQGGDSFDGALFQRDGKDCHLSREKTK